VEAQISRRSVVWDVLREVLAARAAQTGRDRLDVIDAGGGTGGFAVPLAALGHSVTVVDPSPDSLAAAQRRAAEMDVRISAVQGEAAGLDGVVGEDAADLVICHSVLEYVDSPADALAAIARVLRLDGTVSVLASGKVAAVLHRALTGRFDEARALLEGDREAQPGTGPDRADRGSRADPGGRPRCGDLRRPDPQCAGGRRPGRGRVPACAGDGGRDVPRAARHRREAARPRAALRRPP
jgi:SAM-dependent methyltransferase